MRTPVLETNRLILKPIDVSYAKTVFETWASDPRVTKYMLYSEHKDISETEKWLSDAQANIDSDEQYDWGFFIKEDMKLIGSGGTYYKPEQDAFMIGYNIAVDYWNKGFTSEAMRAVVDFLINELNVKKIVSDHAVDNPNSGKVMEKLGLHYDHDGEYTKYDGSKTLKAKFYVMDL